MKPDKKKLCISDIINSSDISQFSYCSVAWYLQKIGYKPDSPKIKEGDIKHKKLGYAIDKTEKYNKKSNIFTIIGFLLLFITLVFFIFEVII